MKRKWFQLRNFCMITTTGLLLNPADAWAIQKVYYPQVATRQWRARIMEKPIKELQIHLRRTCDNDNTYVNMRFGSTGHTFDGKRIYLKRSGTTCETWQLHGRLPQKEDLILNAYNGKVFVEKVTVVYEDYGHHRNHGYRGHDPKSHYSADHGYKDRLRHGHVDSHEHHEDSRWWHSTPETSWRKAERRKRSRHETERKAYHVARGDHEAFHPRQNIRRFRANSCSPH